MATDPPDTHREIFFASDHRVGQGLATFAGLDQTAFSGLGTIEDVSADATAMEKLAASAAYQEVVRSVVAMEAQAADATAMDAVSASSTAMDTVSASSTARDAIGTSGVGYDAIAQVAMAIGKYAAGIAGLTPSNYADIDAVASDANAMDAVSASSTAMDAVASAVGPRTTVLLGSYYDTIFAADVGSDRFYNSSAINPTSGTADGLPYTYTGTGYDKGTYDVSLSADTPSSFDGGNSITCETSFDAENKNQAFAEIELDLSDATTLEYWAKDEGDLAVLLIDGSTVNDMGSSFSWTQFSISVSGYNGTSKIGLGSNFTSSNANTTYYTGLNLS